MSETLRDLVVSLSLNSENFNRNIRSVNRQIVEAQAEFRLAAAGVENFEKSVTGMSAHMGNLQRQVQLQAQATQQYARQLDMARTRLREAVANQQRFTASLEAARRTEQGLSADVTRATASLRAAERAYGAHSAVTNAARDNLQDFSDAHDEAVANVKLLEGQVVALAKASQNAADAVSAAKTGLVNAQTAVRETEAQIRKLNKQLQSARDFAKACGPQLEAMGKKAEAAGKRMKTAGKEMEAAGKSLTRTVTVPIMALGGYALKASIDFEDAFAGVRKTVAMTEKEYATLDKQIRGMTLIKPQTYETIASVAEAAGQLGVANQAIEGFASVMADLGAVSTDLSAEDAATNLAKLANIMGVVGDAQTNEYFERMGSTVLELGVNSAATEAGIVEMGMRLAAAGRQVGLTEAQVLGFATALSSVGIEAQMGGTAFSKALIKMEVAAETGGQALKDFAKISGMTDAQFRDLFRSDPAAAFSAFIAGLGKLDEAGESAIVTLQDIGFKEVRLRDTTLRMVNATELMNSTQKIANNAWRENTAITTRVADRYNTTANRLKMLNNRARLAADTFGAVMVPSLEDAMDGATGFLNSMMAMDESQRKAIISTALWVAGIGPGISILGKLQVGLGTVSAAFGKSLLAASQASTGLGAVWAGVSTLLGPIGIAALAAAAIYGAYKWYDYASGAQAAREAIQGMIETGKQWEQNDVKTIFETGNDPFERFNLNRDQFKTGYANSKQWLDELTGVWSDGAKESNKQVNEYVGSFKDGSDEIRDAIQKRKDMQKKYGVTDDNVAKEDLKKLKTIDAEVAKLLKKRQNDTLSADDKRKLQQLITQRAEIKLKYVTGAGGGFESLAAAVAAEKARLASEGKTPGSDLYADSVTAAAAGYQETVDGINQSYRDQYTEIMTITDEKKRQDALDVLNKEHVMQLKKAREEYLVLLRQYGKESFNTPEIKEAQKDLQTLKDLIGTIQADDVTTPAELKELEAFTAGLDEGKMASLLTLIKTLKDSGLGGINLGTEGAPITASALLGGYDTVAAFLEANKGTWTGGLATMFGALDSEVSQALIDLQLTPDGITLHEWIDNHKAFDIKGVVTAETPEGEQFTISNVKVDMFGTLTGFDGGGSQVTAKNVQVDANGNLVGVTTDGRSFSLSGPNITASAKLTGVTPPDEPLPIQNVTVKAHADYSGIDQNTLDTWFKENPDAKPKVITEVGMQDGWQSMVDTAYKGGLLEVFGPDGAQLDVDAGVLEKIGPDDIYMKGLRNEKGQVVQTILLVPEIGTKDAADTASDALTDRPGDNPFLGVSTLDKVEAAVTQGDIAEAEQNAGRLNEAAQAVADATMYMDTVEASEMQKISDAIAAMTAGLQNGTITGDDAVKAKEQLDLLIKFMEMTKTYTGAGLTIAETVAAGLKGYQWATDAATVAADIKAAVEGAVAKNPIVIEVPVPEVKPAPTGGTTNGGGGAGGHGALSPIGGLPTGTATKVGDILTPALDVFSKFADLNAKDLSAVGQSISDLMTALSTGTLTPEETAQAQERLNQLLELVRLADTYLGVGNDVSAGIAAGMTAYGWGADATTVAAAIESALRVAADSSSPAQLTVPLGQDISAGIALGMMGYGFGSAAGVTAAKAKSALKSEMTGMNDVGKQAMVGFALGILSGQNSVLTAIRIVARKAVQEAKDNLIIKSPSRVFRDEVGRMIPRGIAEGIMQEARVQSRSIKAMTSGMTTAAQQGAVLQQDNRRTYQTDRRVIVEVKELHVRNDGDVRSIALELAQFNKTSYAGVGVL